jgi:phosphohistidine swiveling domain-containing protein
MSLLPKIGSGERDAGEFLAIFGHRAPEDYELAQPRYREAPELVDELASRAKERLPDSRNDLLPPEGSDDRLLRVTVERARHFQVLKEEAKHHALRELATLRTLLVEIDARLELDDGIFYLTLEEVAMLGDQFRDQALGLIDRRRKTAEDWKAVVLPTELTVGQLEALSSEAIATGGAVVVSAGENGGALRGTRVSGDKEVVGRVRLIHHAKEIYSFQAGEILVARFTDPTWTPLFPMAAGVIAEVGGWLSHAAIVAREYNITGIVGAQGAMTALKTGQLVRLCSSGAVEPIDTDRRRHQRVPMSARVALLRQGESIEAILRNLSRTGALVEVCEELETGQGIYIRISADGEEVRAEVVRRDSSGRYALHFTTPLAGSFPQYDLQEGPVKN